ncbi:MAG: hypothetical protein KJ749_04930 [Planctomycetes bacterium]|nr:hypothetical protein [Planctomycetota bacterium]
MGELISVETGLDLGWGVDILLMPVRVQHGFSAPGCDLREKHKSFHSLRHPLTAPISFPGCRTPFMV